MLVQKRKSRTSTLLRAAKKLIHDRWCQGAAFRHKITGKELDGPRRGCLMCVHGACGWVAAGSETGDEYDDMADVLDRAARRLTNGRVQDSIAYNDAKWCTISRVFTLFDLAIKYAVKDEQRARAAHV